MSLHFATIYLKFFDIIIILSNYSLIKFYSKNQVITCSFISIKIKFIQLSFCTIIYNKDIKIIYIIYLKFIIIKGNKLDIILGRGYKIL